MAEVGVLVLGLVQGLCEFLPISSSGHLLLLSEIFGVEDCIFVSIFLHLATLLSIVVALRKELFFMICNPFSKKTINLCLATIPTCIIALILLPLVNSAFGGEWLYLAFLISAIMLFVVQKFTKKTKGEKFSLKNALYMGIAQGLAIFPGISRSGTTISAGLASGGDRKSCAEFSFLLSIPIIIASMAGEVYKICVQGANVSVQPSYLILSFLIAFVVGLLSIKFMIKLTEKANFKWLAIYLVLISLVSRFVF